MKYTCVSSLGRRALKPEYGRDAAPTYSAEEVRAMREAEERLQLEVSTETSAASINNASTAEKGNASVAHCSVW